jgi:hypothetical protein
MKKENEILNMPGMINDIRQFHKSTGAEKIGSPKYILLVLGVSVLSFLLIIKLGIAAEIGLIILPLAFLFLFWIFRKPIAGFYSVVVLDFILLGVSRYLPDDLQTGIAIDGLLVLTYVALIIKRFNTRIDWKPAKKDITLLAAIWFGFSLLQFFNPEIHDRSDYFAGVRGVSFYMMLTIPLVLLFIDNMKKVNIFLYLWGFLSILASLKGIMQITLGVDPWEKQWLDLYGGPTHIIFGQLRAFSFFSDAGQFGANQAYSAVVATILVITKSSVPRRMFFITVAVLGFIGMFISGTRGAISVPLAGFFLFFILRKNIVVLTIGIILLAVVIFFFKGTYIGQNNQFIRRMRSAFNPNDPSLLVRLENQKRLSAYLSTRPFGGGIGQSGLRAKASNTGSVLASTPTDSWYVLIWAEQGIVGLILHLSILLYILIKSSYIIMVRIRDPELKMKMSALASGMLGIMVASYGNAVLGTMPTSILIYSSMALLLSAQKLDSPELTGTSGPGLKNMTPIKTGEKRRKE